jgi:hypothetical protein
MPLAPVLQQRQSWQRQQQHRVLQHLLQLLLVMDSSP